MTHSNERGSIISSELDDDLFIKMTGLRSLKENFERELQAQHPSLAKKNLKVADFFQSKQAKKQ